jgi:hypothetical protein
MKALSTLAVLLFSLTLYAQNNFMSLGAGVNIPMGDYALSKSISNGGFAKTGINAEYSGTYFIKKNLGIGGILKFNSNLTDSLKVANALAKFKDSDVPANTEYTCTNTQWNLVLVAIGPMLTYPFGNFNIDAYFFAGLNVIQHPEMQLTGDMKNDNYYLVYLQTHYAAFGYDAGINLRCRLNDKTGIKIYASYQGTQAKGELLKQIGHNDAVSIQNYQCNIHIINAGIGLIYYL